MNIKIVGTGCPNCLKLEAICNEVVAENNFTADIEKVTDINKFGELEIMITPGLIVNDHILSQGKIPTKSTLKKWLEKFI
jgi:small redox-active disulfide protein 2